LGLQIISLRFYLDSSIKILEFKLVDKNVSLIQLATSLKRRAQIDGVGRILAGAVVILKDKILLVRRSENDEFLPGYMEIPSGKLEEREDMLSGMYRELYEETRLKTQVLLKYIGFFDAVSPDGKSARQFNFLLEPTNDRVMLSTEHSQYLWWNIKNVRDLDLMLMIEPIKTILKEAAKQKSSA
jgi:8-oxo-dGTP pyrophosphatase MutT (NUDIX family)